jgi:hypothetical protein
VCISNPFCVDVSAVSTRRDESIPATKRASLTGIRWSSALWNCQDRQIQQTKTNKQRQANKDKPTKTNKQTQTNTNKHKPTNKQRQTKKRTHARTHARTRARTHAESGVSCTHERQLRCMHCYSGVACRKCTLCETGRRIYPHIRRALPRPVHAACCTLSTRCMLHVVCCTSCAACHVLHVVCSACGMLHVYT